MRLMVSDGFVSALSTEIFGGDAYIQLGSFVLTLELTYS